MEDSLPITADNGNKPLNRETQHFEAKKLNHLMELEFSPEEWLVEELVPADSITMLVGESGAFKTWLALELCLKISTGKPLLEHYATEQNGVLFLDKESGLRRLQQRLRALSAPQDLNFHYSCLDSMEITPPFVRGVKLYCLQNDIKLVVFDSLIRFHHLNENDAGDINLIYESLKILKTAGISCLVLHHQRKPGPSDTRNNRSSMLYAGRGSIDILNCSDHYINILRNDKDNSITVYQNKNRSDAEKGALFTAKLTKKDEKVSWELFKIEKSNKELRDTLKEEILKLVRENPGSNQGQLINKLKEKANELAEKDLSLGEKQLIKELKALQGEGTLRCKTGENNSKLWFYNDNTEGGSQNV